MTEVIVIGEQIVPDAIGTEVGVASDLQRGKPRPREIRSQDARDLSGPIPKHAKALKFKMSEKLHGGDNPM